VPFAGFDDWSDCVDTMTNEEGHDMESAENICGALQAEEKSEHGNVEELKQALERGAGLIADVGVDLVSGVDVPAVDSKWVMTKSSRNEVVEKMATHPDMTREDAEAEVSENLEINKRTQSPLLKADDTDQRITYAAAMIPREPDKEGDVVATPTVEKAAHGFLKQNGGVDTDHSLIDGEGEVVESWVLKEERTFDLPGGETETYGPGTWMTGIEWGQDAWQRIQNGELTGLSIYGMAEHVPLERAAKCCDCGSEVTAGKSGSGDTHKGDGSDSDDMGNENDGDGSDGATDGTEDGPDIGELQASVSDLSDTVSSMSETVESVKDAVETEKQDTQEAAASIAEQYEELAAGDVLDVIEAAAGKELGDVLDALDSVGKEEDMEDDEDDEDEAEKETAEKRADGAKMDKGNSRQTAAKQHDGEPVGTGETPSYAAAAEEYEEGL